MEIKLKKFYKNRKVLITGATGFKGSWLCFLLNYLGAKVIGIGYKPNTNINLFKQLNLKSKIKLYHCDIRNYKKIKFLIKKNEPEIIIHMAAQPLIFESYQKPYETFTINALGTLNVLEILREVNFVKSSIFVTSDKCYKSNFSTKGFEENDRLGGEDPYSCSKACAEIIANGYYKSFFSNKCGIATARAGNVIGGGDWSKNRLIPDAIRSIINNKTIVLRNPNFNRPWQHVLEPVYGYVLLAMKLHKNPKKFSGAYNFGTEKNTITSVKQVIKKMINFWGSGNIKIVKSKLYEQVNLQLNISKVKKIVKWKPVFDIDQAIYQTVDWYKNILVKRKDPILVTKEQVQSYLKSVNN